MKEYTNYPNFEHGNESETLIEKQDPKVINSDLLFESANIIYIQHQNGLYQLRETKAGKLILTK